MYYLDLVTYIGSVLYADQSNSYIAAIDKSAGSFGRSMLSAREAINDAIAR